MSSIRGSSSRIDDTSTRSRIARITVRGSASGSRRRRTSRPSSSHLHAAYLGQHPGTAAVLDGDGVASVPGLDVAQTAAQYGAAMMNEADRFAQCFDLLHPVR